jgi:hypothetical protein
MAFTGQPTGGIGQAGPDSPYTGIVAYFRVDDVDTALARAESLAAPASWSRRRRPSAGSPRSPTPMATP